jgi:hypothetical protein
MDHFIDLFVIYDLFRSAGISRTLFRAFTAILEKFSELDTQRRCLLMHSEPKLAKITTNVAHVLNNFVVDMLNTMKSEERELELFE